MAFSYYPFCLRFVGACLLVFCFSRASWQDATLRPPRNTEGPHTGCVIDIKQREADCRGRGLDDVPQNLSQDIEQLVLSNNNITFLLNSTFGRYTLIKDLDLSDNDIRMIEPGAFYPLKDLMDLDMSDNPNLALPDRGLFRWAVKLDSLYLLSSNLKSLPNDTLKWSAQVSSLHLLNNDISFINISYCGRAQEVSLTFNFIKYLTSENFVFACQTSKLFLEYNPILSVDPDVLASLRVKSLHLGYHPMSSDILRNIIIGISRSLITDLFIRNANLMILPKDVFDPLRDCSLFLLELTFNDIKELSPYVFSNLTRLDELNLNKNDITAIEPVFFEGMQKIRKLNFNNNKIEQVNRHGHIWLIDLYELDLANNNLYDISPSAFLGLGNLTRLNLRSNIGLKVLNITAFTGLQNLKTLDLSDCYILHLGLYTPMLKSLNINYGVFGPVSFTNAQSLLDLEMRDLGLSWFSLWDPDMHRSLFDGLLNLTSLDLGKNWLDKLVHATFYQLSALEDLSLDYCKISYLHPLIFSGLESLQKLDLMGNNIQHLQYNLFEGLPQVITINLDKNLLDSLEETIFFNNSMVKDLTLANNKFSHLNYSTFEPIKSSLSSLDLSMNPIDCNCDIKWLLKLINGQVNLMNKEKTICSPSSLVSFRNKPLQEFDPTELCRVNIVAFCMIPLVVVCLIVIVVLVYHNRWPLRYKLFLLKLAAIGYQEIRDARDHNDYEFDVNIIFYDEDEEWIRDQLRPALEEHLPQFQRNMFGDEDLVLGMHYLDSVDYVVSHSYKTIIVLSRASVSDRWFMLKFRTAMDHVSDTGTEFVVVVFLEDIPDEEIPFLARLYLSDGRPYVYWPDDVRGQEYFWNELAHHLTINLRTNDLIPNE